MKHLFILIAAFLWGVALYAQGTGDKRSSFSLHAGPSWHLGRLLGITNEADAYRDDLRKGVAWDVNYLRQLAGRDVKFELGFLYQGSAYKHTHDDGADKIHQHYLAPQLALTWGRKHYQLRFGGGAGYQLYRDKSTVYAKPRKVTMSKLAGNLFLSAEYFLTTRWGVSARANWIASASESYSVKYHGEEWYVEKPRTGSSYFGQLSLLFGINYHF